MRYQFRRGFAAWDLIFAGERTLVKHQQGAYYVAYLLMNPPPEPIHGLALSLKVAALVRDPSCATTIVDPANGQSVVVETEATIEQYDLGLDDAEAARGLRRKLRELEALLDDDKLSETLKTELRQELQEIDDFQKSHSWRIERAAQKTVRSVRRAINRFHESLLRPFDAEGNPEPVHRAFAAHLHQYLLTPSARYSAVMQARAALAGRFTYEPPPGVVWSK